MKQLKKKYAQIYEQYVNKIYRFIFFKVSSQEIAEDLCSETFLRGWQSFKNNNEEIENPQAFLYQIARNLVIDHYREKGKVQTVSVDCVADINDRTDLEQEIHNRSDMEFIKSALSELKDDYKELIIWHYIEDLSVPEIAQIVNKSEGTVRVALHRALKTLKNRVSDTESDIG